MEDKVYDLISKMYSEFISFKDEMLGFKGDMLSFKDEMLGFKGDMLSFKDDMFGFKDDMLGFKDDMFGFKDEVLGFEGHMLSFKDDITGKLDRNTAELQKLGNQMIRLENQLVLKTSALFDGHKQFTDQIDRLETKVDFISSAVEKQEVEIRVRNKQKNNT